MVVAYSFWSSPWFCCVYSWRTFNSACIIRWARSKSVMDIRLVCNSKSDSEQSTRAVSSLDVKIEEILLSAPEIHKILYSVWHNEICNVETLWRSIAKFSDGLIFQWWGHYSSKRQTPKRKACSIGWSKKPPKRLFPNRLEILID